MWWWGYGDGVGCMKGHRFLLEVWPRCRLREGTLALGTAHLLVEDVDAITNCCPTATKEDCLLVLQNSPKMFAR